MLLADWHVLVRRWYVVVAGLLVTVGLGWAAVQAVPVQYQVTSNTLMLPPRSVDTQGRAVNPFLGLSGLEGIADVVCKTLTGADAVEAMDRAGLGTDFEMYRDPSAAAPVILTVVEAPSQAEALETQKYLLARIPESLSAVQKATDVRSDSYVTSTVFTQDAVAQPVRKSQVRALVVALAFGLAATYLGAGLLDSMLRSRRRPARVTPTPESGPSSAPAPAPEPEPVPAPEPAPAGAPASVPAPASTPDAASDVAPLTSMFPLPSLLRGESRPVVAPSAPARTGSAATRPTNGSLTGADPAPDDADDAGERPTRWGTSS